MIELTLNHRSGVSLYQQLVQQVKSAILVGRLAPGEQLPSVREVAKRAEVNALTVVKAYAALEQQQYVETKWGKGSFVVQTLPQRKSKSAQQHLDALIDQFLVDALPLAGSPRHLLVLLREHLG